MKEIRRIALGLERRKSGAIYCPECDNGFVFNGGSPKLIHLKECSKNTNKPTYLHDKEGEL